MIRRILQNLGKVFPINTVQANARDWNTKYSIIPLIFPEPFVSFNIERISELDELLVFS